jgi:hypothetical protein
MSVVDLILFGTAAATLLLYVYRLTQLQWRKNSPWIIVMHGALASAMGACVERAWYGQTAVLEVATVLGAIAWLIVSFPTWKDGVPPQFESRPMDLDSGHWHQINGGRKSSSSTASTGGPSSSGRGIDP